MTEDQQPKKHRSDGPTATRRSLLTLLGASATSFAGCLGYASDRAAAGTAAVSGRASSEGSERTLTIEGTGTPCHYRFAVTADLRAAAGFPDGSWESIGSDVAEGYVTDEGSADVFAFFGDVESFEFLEGEAAVTLDGERWTPDVGGTTSTTAVDDVDVDEEHFVFTSATELEAAAERALAGEEPWASAWRKIEAAADAVRDSSLASVMDDGGGHRFRLDRNDRHDYRTAIRVGDQVRNLAVAHFVTGEDGYARRAIDQLYHWFLNPDTYQRPTGSGPFGVEQYVTIPKFFMAAAILRGHPHWETKDSETPWDGGSATSAEAALREWARTWAVNLEEPNANNIYVWLQVARAAASVYAGDDEGFERTVENYRSRTAWHDFRGYDDDLAGAFMAELDRDNGYRYQLYRTKAHVMVCEVARHRGVDLYSYTAPTDSGGGPSLRRSFDFMVPYLKAPDDWRWGAGSVDWDRTHEAPGVYEVAHSMWGDRAYREVVDVVGRPVDDGRLLGWVTFSHGDLFDL